MPSAFAQGDGSRTDNPDLLRGTLGSGCAPGTLCHFLPVDLMAPPTVVLPPLVPATAPVGGFAPMTPAPASVSAESAIAGDTVPYIAAIPHSDWDASYGIGLRGAYVRSGDDERFEIQAIPEAALSRRGGSTQLDLGASATVSQPLSGSPHVSAAEIEGAFGYRLSPSAGLAFAGNLELSRDESGEAGFDAGAPPVVAGRLDAAYMQSFGKLDTVVSTGFSRQWVGPETLDDGTRADNAHQGITAYEGGLRLGYALTPVIGIFASGTAGGEVFDAPDPDLGASRTGQTYALRTGVTTNWSDVVTLEASVGSGWRDYEDEGVAEAQSVLYGAALGYAPNATTQLRAGFDTILVAGRGAAGASTSHALTASASHRANSWLALRASASAQWDVPLDGGETIERYGGAVGADIVLGPNTTASIDYSYGWRNDPTALVAQREDHRVSGGISLRY